MTITRNHKVVHLSSVHPADDVRILHKECQSLANAGYDVTLIARAETDHAVGNVKVKAIPPVRGGRFRRMTLGVFKVFRMGLAERGSIYHFHDSELIPIGLLLRLLGKRVVYDAHEDLVAQIQTKAWIPSIARSLVANGTGLVERISAKFFSFIIVANPMQAERFPPRSTVAVQNFPMLVEFETLLPLPYAKRDDCVFYVGGLSTIRGVYGMVRAIELVNQVRPVSLRLGGDFSPPQLLAEISKEPGWAYTMHLGRLSRQQIMDELAKTKVGLVVVHPVPNYLSNQPVKLFEYMMAGVPAVASNIPNYKQFVEGSQTGVLVDPLHPRKIADAILWLLDHPTEAEQMGVRGRQAVQSRFNWESQAETLIAVYDSIV